MSNYKSFTQEIWVKFKYEDWSMEENPGAIGYSAKIKCSVCRKYNIDITPTHKEKNEKGLDIKMQYPLEVLLKEIKPLIEKPVCSKCQSGIDELLQKEQRNKK